MLLEGSQHILGKTLLHPFTRVQTIDNTIQQVNIQLLVEVQQLGSLFHLQSSHFAPVGSIVRGSHRGGAADQRGHGVRSARGGPLPDGKEKNSEKSIQLTHFMQIW